MTTLFPEALAARAVGNCSLCGRPLTDPESVRRGVGPVCCPPPPKPPRPVPDQPALPGMAVAQPRMAQEEPETSSRSGESSEPERGPQETAQAVIGIPRWAGMVYLRWRGVEVAVEDKPGEDPQQTLERVFAAWMFLAQGRHG